jgi:hypothetical protein
MAVASVAGSLGMSEIFGLVTGRWSEGAPMPTPRGGLTAAAGRQQLCGNETGIICYAGAGSDLSHCGLGSIVF